MYTLCLSRASVNALLSPFEGPLLRVAFMCGVCVQACLVCDKFQTRARPEPLPVYLDAVLPGREVAYHWANL